MCDNTATTLRQLNSFLVLWLQTRQCTGKGSEAVTRIVRSHRLPAVALRVAARVRRPKGKLRLGSIRMLSGVS